MIRKLRVKNNTEGLISRGGYVFNPLGEKEVIAREDQYTEIRAARALTVEVLEEGDGSVPPLATTSEESPEVEHMRAVKDGSNEQPESAEKDSNPFDASGQRMAGGLVAHDETEKGGEGDTRNPVGDGANEQEESAHRDSNPYDHQADALQASGEDEYVCEVCGFEAKSSAGLASHKRTHEEDEGNESTNNGE